MFKHEKQLFHPVSVERIKVVYENLYRQIDDKMVKETIDFLLNRASSMYFSMSGPSPRTAFPVKDVKPVSFEK